MSLALNVVAPSFDPATVGGAGTAMVELIREFLHKEPATRIFLNSRTAELYPEWSESIVRVPTGSHASTRPPALSLLKLQFLGSPALPRTGTCWFPFGFMTPSSWRGRGVATIYDTLEWDLPHCLPSSQRAFRRWIVKRTTKITRIVTASEFSRKQVQLHYGVDATVIPLAPVPLPAPSQAKVPAKPYVFFPAIAWPHKNHRFLLETWLKHPELRELSLVFTLSSGTQQLASHIDAARRNGVNIIITGHVTTAELAGLYAGAQCMVFPSLYEGFGLPVQEALQCGCPALISNRGSLPETVRADYPFILPLDASIWASAVLSNPRQTARDTAAYLSKLTWHECAENYLSVFEACLQTNERNTPNHR
ncbi:hypothetical protein AYO41_01620 [Verrucomicrobia bacterium SCGC AG-212-E04]|nr:hypothetical protein AYO41_01620 [Verrucomicrobia bacterium SCGC AG-212-E04]